MKRLRCFIFVVGVCVLNGSPARAHAFLNDADPKVGATVQISPLRVKIWFTRHIMPGRSTAQVFDSAGREVDQKDSRIDSSDPALLVVSMPPQLSNGVYKVVWTAVCVDQHVTHGTYDFSVNIP